MPYRVGRGTRHDFEPSKINIHKNAKHLNVLKYINPFTNQTYLSNNKTNFEVPEAFGTLNKAFPTFSLNTSRAKFTFICRVMDIHHVKVFKYFYC